MNDSESMQPLTCKTSSWTEKPTTKHGIASLTLTYAPQKRHVEKSRAIIDSEFEGTCAICGHSIGHNRGIYAVCPHPGCESVSHLTCLSKSFLEAESREPIRSRGSSNTEDGLALIPLEGRCKDCGGTIKWIDVVKEATLRIRGAKEVERLLKEPKKKASKVPTPRKRKPIYENASTSTQASSDTDELKDDNDSLDELDELEDGNPQDEGGDDLDVTEDEARFYAASRSDVAAGKWFVIDDSDDDDTTSETIPWHENPDRDVHLKGVTLDSIVEIEDSDCDDVHVLD